MKIELPDELMESIKNQIAEYEKENQKPDYAIDYENGCVILDGRILSSFTYSIGVVKKLCSIGLYRDTKEEAEKLLRKMQIEHRLRQWAKMCKEKVDWKKRSQPKHCLCKSASSGNLEIDSNYSYTFNDVYFTDKSILQRAIEDIGEQNLIDNYFIEV